MDHGDLIQINDLTLVIPLRLHGSESSTPRLERVYLTLALEFDIQKCARLDDIASTVNYASLADAIVSHFTGDMDQAYSPKQLVSTVYDLLKAFPDIPLKDTRMVARIPRTSLSHGSISAQCTFKGSSDAVELVESLCGLEISTLVGIDPRERKYRQPVRVDASFTYTMSHQHARTIDAPSMSALEVALTTSVATTDYLTLEALATRIAQESLRFFVDSSANGLTESPATVNIHASKPLALTNALSPEISITRGFEDFPSLFRYLPTTKSWVSLDTHPHPDPSPLLIEPDVVEDQETHKVVLALGSNLGDSCQNIEHALRLLEEPSRFFTDNSTSPHVAVVDTSFMYQTAPMYVTEQPSFFNCACIVESNVRPLALLKFLKHIEDKVGRVPSIRNGPRAVDLDIVFYDDFVLDTRPPTQRAGLDNLHGELVVPHPRSYEREFVLRPLCDMIPDFVHPTLNKTISDLLRDLPGIDPSMKRVVPFPKCPTNPGSTPVTSTHWTYCAQPNQRRSPLKTHIMATLNVTPDSFSDGSDHVETTAAMAYVESSVASGASIVDIGGYSTRPGASFISIEEEISRVLPAVRAIRQHDNPRVRDILISVDTFRPEVAEAAINAGANCINDVYAFTGPDSYPYNGPNDYMLTMKGVARKLAVPVILMHSRGDAGKNKDYSEFSYAKRNEADSQEEEQVLEGVKVELGRQVDDCVKGQGGLRRWMVIVDPGIGFSKTLEGNLELLRNANRVTTDVTIGDKSPTTRNPLYGYPTLIGASRKSFLGVILSQGENGRETIPKERNWATAAAVACAVQQGALIVRVHDTSEMADVVAVASRIW